MSVYVTTHDPPAPLLDVTVANVVNRRRRRSLPSLLDTGSDQVVAAIAAGESALRAYPLRLMALRLGLVAGFDDLLSLDSIDFESFDYQIKAARAALRRFRGALSSQQYNSYPC